MRLELLNLYFHTAIYRLSSNSAIEETVEAQWPHLKRSMGVVLDNSDERLLVWHDHASRAGMETAKRLAGLADTEAA